MTMREQVLAVALLVGVVNVAAAQQPAAPEPPKIWEGTAGAGLSLTRGNSDTVTYNLAFDLAHTPKARNVTKATGLYLRGEQEDEVIVNRTALGLRDEYTLSGRTFLFGQVDYLRDTFKLIDYLVAPTAGIGYKVINTDPTKFLIDAGGGGVWEKNPGFDVDASAAITAAERLNHALTPTASIKHAITGLWKADDFEDGLYTFSLGLGTQISPRVLLSIDVLDTFKNKPPTPTTKKSDVALVTAITAKY